MSSMDVEVAFAFPALYEARFIAEVPAGPRRLVEFHPSSQRASGTAVLVQVTGRSIEPWVAETTGQGSTLGSALTGIYSTPNPHRLCVVVEGDAYVVDVRQPDSYEVIATSGPVSCVKPVKSEGLLLFATPWKVTAIDEGKTSWQTSRLAIEGIRLDEVQNGWLAGTADPEDEEPRDFVINLRTGEHQGGFPSDI